MLPEMRMVIDVTSREEDENCSKWAPVGCKGRSLCYWDPFFASFLGNCSRAVQAEQASQ